MAPIAAERFRPVSPPDIRLGEPLPYSVYDAGGMLLLKAGFVINTERQRNVLIENGSYISLDEVRAKAARTAPLAPPPVRDEQNAFEMFDVLKQRLASTFDLCRADTSPDDFRPRVEGIALTIQEACTHDTDAALANLHLDYDTSYPVIHHLQAALLCELIGRKLGVPDATRLPLINAALTHDIGLIDIQDTLDRQLEPLSEAQRARIARHPASSEAVLRKRGIHDANWLDPVRHHHERIDGSGYPDAIAGDAIRLPARILAIADIYSAMLRDRPYRKAMVTTEAMRKLMAEQGQSTDNRLITMMIKEIGVFPPGAIVKLANNEIAVVKKRTENSAAPHVFAFIRDDGMPMLTPQARKTTLAAHRIEGIVSFSNYRGSVAILRGLWTRN